MVIRGKRKAIPNPVPSDGDNEDFNDSEGELSDEVSESTSPSSSDSSGDESKSEVDLAFISYNMDRSDYHAISQFLTVTFGRGIATIKGGECVAVDTITLGKIIVELFGEYVGATAKAAEEDGPLAFVSLTPFNLTRIEFGWRE